MGRAAKVQEGALLPAAEFGVEAGTAGEKAVTLSGEHIGLVVRLRSGVE